MSTQIEPGLLNLFRWYVGIRLGFLVLVWFGVQSDDPPEPAQAPGLGIVLFGALLLFLVVPWFRKVAGRAFLPIAIVAATIAPIADAVQTIDYRLDLGYSPNEALSDYWIPFFLLFVPFILIVWQYRYRWVLVFAIGSTTLDLIATGGVLAAYADAQLAFPLNLEVLAALVVARGALFAFVGFFISKLVARQRDLREDLRAHAVAVEQVSTARERTRLARELHDTLAHTLSGIAVQLEAATGVWDIDEDRARGLVADALAASRTGLEDARRAIEDLRASPLDDLGLVGALCALIENQAATSGLSISYDGPDATPPLPPDTEHAVYRIVEEALHNAVRHAEATSVRVVLRVRGDAVEGEIRDDGVGFDPESVPEGRHGIRGMGERAELVGGSASITSEVGAGSTVRFSVPRRGVQSTSGDET